MSAIIKLWNGKGTHKDFLHVSRRPVVTKSQILPLQVFALCWRVMESIIPDNVQNTQTLQFYSCRIFVNEWNLREVKSNLMHSCILHM